MMRTRPPGPGSTTPSAGSVSLGLAPLAPAGRPCPLPARRGGGRCTILARYLRGASSPVPGSAGLWQMGSTDLRSVTNGVAPSHPGGWA
jgi:hypothetical protein